MAKTSQRRRSSIKREFNEKELQDLRTAFMMLDSNGDGKITPDDLSDMLKRLRIEIQTETIDELMRTASHSGVELMDENEFLAWVKRIQDVLPEQTSEDSRKDLMAAFQVFDLDHNGFITKDELKVAMEKIGEPLTDDQITYIIKMADLDMDGKINYEEFAKLML